MARAALPLPFGCNVGIAPASDWLETFTVPSPCGSYPQRAGARFCWPYTVRGQNSIQFDTTFEAQKSLLMVHFFAYDIVHGAFWP
jgi:hypothetical protein